MESRVLKERKKQKSALYASCRYVISDGQEAASITGVCASSA